MIILPPSIFILPTNPDTGLPYANSEKEPKIEFKWPSATFWVSMAVVWLMLLTALLVILFP